ncbi:MAG TPA: hypothetical protein PK919_07955 [Candidatus Aminicenantes bacterium]|nr:hypothetical protein [Candidatus Aminicenantes bacterium]
MTKTKSECNWEWNQGLECEIFLGKEMGAIKSLDLGHWNLEFIWDLVLGAWNFSLTGV